CSGLTSINIPNSVTGIGDYTFYGCSGLTHAVININGDIGREAFYNCSNLTILFLGVSVKDIAPDAFENTGIKQVILPEKFASKNDSWFTSFGKDVNFHFYNASEGLDIVYEDDCMFSRNREILYWGLNSLSGDYIIPETVKTIIGVAFIGCDKLKSVLIPPHGN
ncbi:MAG: leucine-rich repeat domain-containing protein, partial [Muribaculaceae bacterium]|nr:leucine-rich repeat domain-containing protein [Muribaculaceae bacterium]